FMMPL
ncbi:gamma-glutamyltranspeptidase family protein, partial [Vibrio parahaemolyticus AQ3810]